MIYRRAKNPRPFDRERAPTALAERSGGGGVFERRRRRRSLHQSYRLAQTLEQCDPLPTAQRVGMRWVRQGGEGSGSGTGSAASVFRIWTVSLRSKLPDFDHWSADALTGARRVPRSARNPQGSGCKGRRLTPSRRRALGQLFLCREDRESRIQTFGPHKRSTHNAAMLQSSQDADLIDKTYALPIEHCKTPVLPYF
jgi:hypothetical protein